MICRSKWFIPKYPLAPGHEIIAEVSQVGSEVKDFKKGDLVGFGTIREICGKCKYCKKWLEESVDSIFSSSYDSSNEQKKIEKIEKVKKRVKKKKESIKKDINQNKKIKNTNKNSDTKHHEINDGQNIYKQSPNESNNKNIEKDKIIDKGKITNNTNSVKNYLNNYINSNYKTVSSEKINNENYNDLTLKTFNNSSNYENDVYNSVGKKALTKLKYNYYKNMSQSNDYRLNEANKNYLNNINLDNNNNNKCIETKN